MLVRKVTSPKSDWISTYVLLKWLNFGLTHSQCWLVGHAIFFIFDHAISKYPNFGLESLSFSIYGEKVVNFFIYSTTDYIQGTGDFGSSHCYNPIATSDMICMGEFRQKWQIQEFVTIHALPKKSQITSEKISGLIGCRDVSF